MRAMGRFSKMHGLGNDFVVIDAREAAIDMTQARAQAIADRHAGIGCDQLILIGDSDRADVSMRIFNSDGSEVEACGNATRCVPLFVGRDVLIETQAGLLDAKSVDGGASVDMGQPRLEWDAIPLAYAMDTLDMPVSWEGLPAPVAVNVGNPHVIFFVDDMDGVNFDHLGPLIETDPLFPARVNVNFAQIVGDNHIRLIVWERGGKRGGQEKHVMALEVLLPERAIRPSAQCLAQPACMIEGPATLAGVPRRRRLDG